MLVFISVMVTFALETGAPDVSDTVPSTVAFTACAATGVEVPARMIPKSKATVKLHKASLDARATNVGLLAFECDATPEFTGKEDCLLMTSPRFTTKGMLTPLKSTMTVELVPNLMEQTPQVKGTFQER